MEKEEPTRRRLVEPAPNQPYLVAPGKLAVQKLPDFKMTSTQSTMLTARIERWPIAGSFIISRGAKTQAVTVVAEVNRGGHTGRGECVPYPRYGETPEATLAALQAMREPVSRGLERQILQAAMPPGAARNALDCALLDLEAKTQGRRVWDLLGRPAPQACVTAYTISLASPETMAAASAKAAHRPLLKIKLGGDGDGERIEAHLDPNSSSMRMRHGPPIVSSEISRHARTPASRWSSSRFPRARMRRWRASRGRFASAPTKACTIAHRWMDCADATMPSISSSTKPAG
jgi:L-alanine-DL-glutamate epimerase-like enolase superfamily enzyme